MTVTNFAVAIYLITQQAVLALSSDTLLTFFPTVSGTAEEATGCFHSPQRMSFPHSWKMFVLLFGLELSLPLHWHASNSDFQTF